MIANYHTHTTRCHHATGEDEEYVKAAIDRGVKILGFSDHTPQFFLGDYVNPDKMLPSEMAGYFDSILALKEKYKNDIEIHVGFETEYYPKIFDRLVEEYRKFPVEYLILGQHRIGNDSFPDCFTAYAATDDPAKLRTAVAQMTDAINTGRFSYIAHPDFFHFVGDEALYRAEMTPFVLRAKELGIPLEINLFGMTDGRHYPNDRLWKLIGELGAPAILGCDAHSPDRVAKPDELSRAHAYADRFGVTLVDTIRLVDPRF